MATGFADNAGAIREVINDLQSSVADIQTLLALLSSPLDCLGLLPPQFRRHNVHPLPENSVYLSKHIPLIQRALLEHIAPTWDNVLVENDAILLLEQYFCPDSFSFASPVAGDIALLAYSTILSLPLGEYAIRLLTRLTAEYPLDRLHSAVFTRKARDVSSRQALRWEDYVRNICMIPAKVANAAAGRTEIPPILEHGAYFNNLCVRCECLMVSLSARSQESISSISYLFNKLVNLGVFPSTPPVSRSQPSFFQSTLPQIRARLSTEASSSYSNFWSALMLSLPSTSSLQSILTSLIASLRTVQQSIDSSQAQRALFKREAQLLSDMIGILTPDRQELWETVSAIILGLGRDWNEAHARIYVCWASSSRSGQINEPALDILLANVMETWSSSDHIKHSLLSRHHYITALLLITVSYYPPSSNQVQSLAFSQAFISGIGIYIAHLDPSVRRCGMLVAECVAQLSGKKLDFGDWDGEDSGKPWTKQIRHLIKGRDVDCDLSSLEEVPSEIEHISTIGVQQTSNTEASRAVFVHTETGYDSDDSITGYASPPSSRSASPTPSELAEIEKDPTLGVGAKKIPRPVYLAQLGEMVRSTGGVKPNDDNYEADRIEMALKCAEELIRKKRAYGTELDENAVNLVYGLLGLQDNYELEGFDVKRQSAMNALIACSPRKAAPSLIEEFFKNQYSTAQRYVALNALALGARELASLPVPSSAISEDRISFPSKMLPSSLHRKYVVAGKQDTDTVPLILAGISRQAINKSKDDTVDGMPEIVRERRLRIQKDPKILDVAQLRNAPVRSPINTTFTEVAAEYFIVPLLNRFWLFLRDEQTREERTAQFDGRQRYHGAGTGLILNPIVLAHFLRTMAILVHASQNAPEWLAIIAPDALELAVTIGTRPVSHMETDNDDDGDEASSVRDGGRQGKEASVLTSALELALIVLDGCLELDGGRILGLEHTTLLLSTGEWASVIFSRLEKGVRFEGGGGLHEVNLNRAAAGVVIKVNDVTSKWRRSMIDT